MKTAKSMVCGLCLCLAWASSHFATAEDQPALEKKNAAAELVVRTYPVAELVIPVKQSAKPRFDDLIQYLQTTIGEKAWNREGASIRTSEMTLSLVIRQTPDGHERIADALGKLRRQQDLQVSVAITIVTGPRREIQALSNEFPGELGRAEQEQLLERIQKSATVTQLISPKITLFDRSAGVVVQEGKTLVIQGEIADDRRSTRIKLAQYSKDRVEEAVLTCQSLVLHDGRAAAVRFEAPRIVPGLPPTDEAEERLVIVTPMIILREEEEELLGIPTR